MPAPDGQRRQPTGCVIYRGQKHDGRHTQRTRHPARGLDQAPRSTTVNQPTAPAITDRDTTGAFLGGADQFSMDNLAKKGH